MSGTDSRAGMARSNAARASTGTGHGMRSNRSRGMASAQDNMADQLNAQSLQATQQGHTYSAGGADMGGAMSAPNAAAGSSTPGGGNK
jgi:hypothetical protein